MLLLRKIIFWLFLSAYLVLCPVLVLYALGYILNPAKPQLVQTGLVYFSTNPSGADIFLGKSRFSHKTPTSIQELKPGSYDIKILLKGYKPWEHSFIIAPGQANVFSNVLLIPSSWHKEAIFGKQARELLPIEGTELSIISTGQTLDDFYIFDWKRQICKKLLPQSYGDYNRQVFSVFTQEKSNQIIIQAGARHKTNYLLFKNLNDKISVTDISGLFPSKPNSLKWQPNEPDHIFAFYNDRVIKINLRNFSFDPLFLAQIKGFYLGERWFYYMEPSGRIMRISFDKSRQEHSIDGPFDGYSPKSEFYRIKNLKNRMTSFLGVNGDLFINDYPFALEEYGVRDTLFSGEKNELIYWTKQKIIIAGEDPVNSNRLIKRQVYTSGHNITQCFLVNNGSHLIFKDAQGIFLLELEPKSTNHIEEIVRAKSGTMIFYSEASGSLYYLDELSGFLTKIKIRNTERL